MGTLRTSLFRAFGVQRRAAVSLRWRVGLLFLLVGIIVIRIGGYQWAGEGAAVTSPALTSPQDASWIDASSKEFDMRLGARQLVRGLCQLNGDKLQLALPIPGNRRPENFESVQDDDTRIIRLTRQATRTGNGNKILGTWTVIASFQGGRPSQQFLGDTVLFNEKLMTISQTTGETPYQVPYRMGNAAQPRPSLVEEQKAQFRMLQEDYDADIELNDLGQIVRLTIAARSGQGPKRQFSQALATQLARLTTLEELVLTDFDSDLSAARMAFLKKLTRLSRLDVRKTGISDQALAHLAELPALRVLKLEFNDRLTDAAAIHLQPLTNLVELDLAFVKISDAGMKSLSHLTRLKRLYLYGTNITDRGVAQLAGLKDLQVLYLGSEQGQDVTDISAKVLAEMKSLEMLGLYGTRVSSAAAERLKSTLPNCHILVPQRKEMVPHAETTAGKASEGTVRGTLTLGDQEYQLNHVVAYRLKLENRSLTTVLMTSEPVLFMQLDQCLERHGDDYTFAPFVPQIRLRFNQHGQLVAVHLYADEFTVNGSGNDILCRCEFTSDQARGTVRMNQAGMFDGKSFQIDAEFDVEIR
ncbi:MAG TPA: hypothetical protein EYG57_01570 [Planctomycetes bacterium]|nr:hypothetical protein [Planctomycetota bacterium]